MRDRYVMPQSHRRAWSGSLEQNRRIGFLFFYGDSDSDFFRCPRFGLLKVHLLLRCILVHKRDELIFHERYTQGLCFWLNLFCENEEIRMLFKPMMKTLERNLK